jgi:hypothetical protein
MQSFYYKNVNVRSAGHGRTQPALLGGKDLCIVESLLLDWITPVITWLLYKYTKREF